MPKSAPKIDASQVFALADQGLSQREIATRLGTSHVSIGNRLRARPPAGQPAVPAAPAAPEPATAAPLRDRLLGVAALLVEAGFPSEAESVREALAALAATAVPAVPAEPDQPDEPEPATHLERCKRMYASMLRLATDAQQMGNLTAASRSMRDAGALAAVIARVERTTRDDEGVLRVSRAEIAEAMRALHERKKILCQRPLLCADCGRKLSIRWAFDGDPPAETVEGGQ